MWEKPLNGFSRITVNKLLLYFNRATQKGGLSTCSIHIVKEQLDTQHFFKNPTARRLDRSLCSIVDRKHGFPAI